MSSQNIGLAALDMAPLAIIMGFCATSPTAKFNAVASSGRRLNIAWRKMHRRLMKDMMQHILDIMKISLVLPTDSISVRGMNQILQDVGRHVSEGDRVDDLHLHLLDFADVWM